MKRGTKQFIKRLAAAAIAAACVLTLPASAAKAGSPAFTINASAATKKLKYYSSDYYDAASRDMIYTLVKPIVLSMEQVNTDEYYIKDAIKEGVRGVGSSSIYTYPSEEALYKDAAFKYLKEATAQDQYVDGSYVCENFASTLEYRIRKGWVHGKKVGNVVKHDYDAAWHAYNIATFDGEPYILEPQGGVITCYGYSNPKIGDNLNWDDYEKISGSAPSTISARVYMINRGDMYITEEDEFRLNPLQVLRAHHPELFANKAVFREFCENNPEIRIWQEAWYSAKYHNDLKSSYKFDKLIE